MSVILHLVWDWPVLPLPLHFKTNFKDRNRRKMHILNKAGRIVTGMLLCIVLTLFFCVQHREDDSVLNWIDFDTIPPVITLLGNNPDTITLASSYIEFGATAYDSVDGDLTALIQIDDSDVDTSTAGTYQVVYTVSDYAENAATKNRTVQVVSGKFFTK